MTRAEARQLLARLLNGVEGADANPDEVHLALSVAATAIDQLESQAVVAQFDAAPARSEREREECECGHAKALHRGACQMALCECKGVSPLSPVDEARETVLAQFDDQLLDDDPVGCQRVVDALIRAVQSSALKAAPLVEDGAVETVIQKLNDEIWSLSHQKQYDPASTGVAFDAVKELVALLRAQKAGA